jgi:hypothetical protein
VMVGPAEPVGRLLLVGAADVAAFQLIHFGVVARSFAGGAGGPAQGAAVLLFGVSWGLRDLALTALAGGGGLAVAFGAGLGLGIAVGLLSRLLRWWPGGALTAAAGHWLVVYLVGGFIGLAGGGSWGGGVVGGGVVFRVLGSRASWLASYLAWWLAGRRARSGATMATPATRCINSSVRQGTGRGVDGEGGEEREEEDGQGDAEEERRGAAVRLAGRRRAGGEDRWRDREEDDGAGPIAVIAPSGPGTSSSCPKRWWRRGRRAGWRPRRRAQARSPTVHQGRVESVEPAAMGAESDGCTVRLLAISGPALGARSGDLRGRPV